MIKKQIFKYLTVVSKQQYISVLENFHQKADSKLGGRSDYQHHEFQDSEEHLAHLKNFIYPDNFHLLSTHEKNYFAIRLEFLVFKKLNSKCHIVKMLIFHVLSIYLYTMFNLF